MKKAVFIDKDGTLVYDVPYNVNPDLVRLTDGAIAGLKKLTDAGYELFVVSNQQGIGLGYFAENDLISVKEKLDSLLTVHGIALQGFYYCPHLSEENCSCRKPKPGMIFQAVKEHAIDLSESWMIGDIPTDIEAGKRAGCRTVLFDKGYENENTWEFSNHNRPDFVCRSLDEAAGTILNRQPDNNTYFLF